MTLFTLSDEPQKSAISVYVGVECRHRLYPTRPAPDRGGQARPACHSLVGCNPVSKPLSSPMASSADQEPAVPRPE